jgi:hypothetical protein
MSNDVETGFSAVVIVVFALDPLRQTLTMDSSRVALAVRRSPPLAVTRP